MENFVFPDEIKAKLMKMNEELFLHPLKLTKFLSNGIKGITVTALTKTLLNTKL